MADGLFPSQESITVTEGASPSNFGSPKVLDVLGDVKRIPKEAVRLSEGDSFWYATLPFPRACDAWEEDCGVLMEGHRSEFRGGKVLVASEEALSALFLGPLVKMDGARLRCEWIRGVLCVDVEFRRAVHALPTSPGGRAVDAALRRGGDGQLRYWTRRRFGSVRVLVPVNVGCFTGLNQDPKRGALGGDMSVWTAAVCAGVSHVVQVKEGAEGKVGSVKQWFLQQGSPGCVRGEGEVQGEWKQKDVETGVSAWEVVSALETSIAYLAAITPPPSTATSSFLLNLTQSAPRTLVIAPSRKRPKPHDFHSPPPHSHPSSSSSSSSSSAPPSSSSPPPFIPSHLGGRGSTLTWWAGRDILYRVLPRRTTDAYSALPNCVSRGMKDVFRDGRWKGLSRQKHWDDATDVPFMVQWQEEALREAMRVANSEGTGAKLCIIVPYRSQPEQNRHLQLERFTTLLPPILDSLIAKRTLSDYHILVVEQSNDGYKFNRGKLLNVGFLLASSTTPSHSAPMTPAAASGGGGGGGGGGEGGVGRDGSEGGGSVHLPRTLQGQQWNSFCMHDVDLVPRGRVLQAMYGIVPAFPVHIGAAWPRYRVRYTSYCGGILSMSSVHMRRSGGFPNNFWGWGGEDDVLTLRLRKVGFAAAATFLRPDLANSSPADLAIEDLEETIQKERGSGVRASDGDTSFLNQLKDKLIGPSVTLAAEGKNCIDDCDYTVTGVKSIAPRISIVTVNLHPEKDPNAQKMTKS